MWSGHAQNLHWENETFDAAFAVEATCHSPDKVSQDTLDVRGYRCFQSRIINVGIEPLRCGVPLTRLGQDILLDLVSSGLPLWCTGSLLL